MNWFLKLLGFKGSLHRKKLKLELIQKKAFDAQRNGNLRLAGKYFLEAELLETEIVDLQLEKKNENKK